MSKACVIVHWPGNDVPACVEHASQLAGIAQAMGIGLSMTPLVSRDEWECTNCENEAKAAAKKGNQP